MARIVYPLVIAALMASAVPAFAADVYRGALTDKDRPVPVTLTIEAHKYPGDAAGQIRFGEPWACDLKLEFSGTNGQTDTYSFKGAGAGACSALNLGFMQSHLAGTSLQIELFDQKKASRQKVSLTPVK
ncbi:MAG: hypothetical protein H7Z12_00960 [Rhodospirillaceae bacterium]|nr:hypothetical protein [Rhodospirillales bacterium]